MRTYSVAEARKLLPLVRPVLESIREAFTRLRGLQAARGADARAAGADGHAIVDPYAATAAAGEPERLQEQLRQGMARLEGWGIELKDPARGLIDFYHDRDGRTVYLCYELGEDGIAFWHPVETGFAGRRPL